MGFYDEYIEIKGVIYRFEYLNIIIFMQFKNKFRIFVVGTNKAFKQKLINSIFTTQTYNYPTIEKQNNIYIFRHTQQLILLTYPKKITKKSQIVNFERTGEIASGNQISQYFSMYYKQKNLLNSNQIGEFLIQCSSKLEVQQQILDCIQIYDLPYLFTIRSFQMMDYFEDLIRFDLLIIAMNEKQYIAQNYGNICKNLFQKIEIPQQFENIKKIWVVESHFNKKINKAQLSLFKQKDLFYEYTNSDQDFLNFLSKQIEKKFEHEKINEIKGNNYKLEQISRPQTKIQNQIPQKFQTKSQIQQKLIEQQKQQKLQFVNSNQQQIKNVESNQKIPPLFLTESQIRGLSNTQISDLIQLLQTDTSKYTYQQYNQFLETIGFNKKIKISQLSYTREIFCFVLLLFAILYSERTEFLIVGIIIGISAITRTKHHKTQTDNSIKQQKIRIQKILYGEQGIIDHKVKELKRRRQLRT